jgi:hypothetical protein
LKFLFIKDILGILTNPKYEEKLFYLVGDIFKNKVNIKIFKKIKNISLK